MTVKVLAIDDSRTIRSLVQKVMQDAGFDCVCAVDGVDGIARFAEVTPDVVITDINMPNMDGYGVISTGWIVKPFDDETIVSVVRRVTGARG